jgi:hypothetical protein
MGRDARRTEGRQACLLLGVEAVGNDLTDVKPEQVRRRRRHHELVRPIRVGQPALRDRQAVLVEVEAVDAGSRKRRDEGVGAEAGGAVGTQREGIQGDRGLDLFHAGQMGDLSRGGRGVADLVGAVEAAIDRHAQVRWVGAGQVRGEGRLGTPGGRHRAHGNATHQPDQEGKGQVAVPATPEAGPEPVPSDTQILPGHGSLAPNRYAFTLPPPPRLAGAPTEACLSPRREPRWPARGPPSC